MVPRRPLAQSTVSCGVALIGALLRTGVHAVHSRRSADPNIDACFFIAVINVGPNARICLFRGGSVARYIQKISLRPYSETEIWTGWELEGREGPIDGLVFAEAMSEEELAQLGVTEFQKIPKEYLGSEFMPRK